MVYVLVYQSYLADLDYYIVSSDLLEVTIAC